MSDFHQSDPGDELAGADGYSTDSSFSEDFEHLNNVSTIGPMDIMRGQFPLEPLDDTPFKPEFESKFQSFFESQSNGVGAHAGYGHNSEQQPEAQADFFELLDSADGFAECASISSNKDVPLSPAAQHFREAFARVADETPILGMSFDAAQTNSSFDDGTVFTPTAQADQFMGAQESIDVNAHRGEVSLSPEALSPASIASAQSDPQSFTSSLFNDTCDNGGTADPMDPFNDSYLDLSDQYSQASNLVNPAFWNQFACDNDAADIVANNGINNVIHNNGALDASMLTSSGNINQQQPFNMGWASPPAVQSFGSVDLQSSFNSTPEQCDTAINTIGNDNSFHASHGAVPQQPPMAIQTLEDASELQVSSQSLSEHTQSPLSAGVSSPTLAQCATENSTMFSTAGAAVVSVEAFLKMQSELARVTAENKAKDERLQRFENSEASQSPPQIAMTPSNKSQSARPQTSSRKRKSHSSISDVHDPPAKRPCASPAVVSRPQASSRKRKSSSAIDEIHTPPAKRTCPSPALPSMEPGIITKMWSPGVTIDQRAAMGFAYTGQSPRTASRAKLFPTTTAKVKAPTVNVSSPVELPSLAPNAPAAERSLLTPAQSSSPSTFTSSLNNTYYNNVPPTSVIDYGGSQYAPASSIRGTPYSHAYMTPSTIEAMSTPSSIDTPPTSAYAPAGTINTACSTEVTSTGSPVPKTKSKATKAKTPRASKKNDPKVSANNDDASKVTKTRTPAKKRTPNPKKASDSAAVIQCERPIAELYAANFTALTQHEKARLLLPLIYGLDPITGTKYACAGNLAPKLQSALEKVRKASANARADVNETAASATATRASTPVPTDDTSACDTSQDAISTLDLTPAMEMVKRAAAEIGIDGDMDSLGVVRQREALEKHVNGKAKGKPAQA